ncbi:hypothetical protein SVAN01_11151 [Stagonosporopsis vannaccii]|nr:hypothetical protein SVAN01_11151 [Stagonosporopsis vannaccii]
MTTLMAPQPSLTRVQYLTHGLLPVFLASATNTCLIRREVYPEESPKQPIVLPECGHIFCRTCITAWFDSSQRNTNSCPLTGSHDALIAAPADMGRAARSLVEEILMGDLVAALDGRLTYAGRRFVVKNVWRCTRWFLRWLEVPSGEPCVQAAVPTGVRCEELEWAALYDFAMQMLA